MDCRVHFPQPSSAGPEQRHAPAMVDYDQAQALLAQLAKSLPAPQTEFIPLSQARGRILAQNLKARTPRPEADISAMDGYALCCADIPDTGQSHVTLPLRDYITAGDCPPPHQNGTAATILTGARIPLGADCVIARERVEMCDGTLRLALSDIAPGKNIRREGEEFPTGSTLLTAGQKLDWRHVALLASQNMKQLAVYKQVRIGLIANGAEFADNAQDCRAEINTPLLTAMLESLGLHVVTRVVGSDNRQDLQNAVLEMEAQSDVLITTGGISVGQTDHVLPVMEQLGASCLFRRVKIKPGKPLTVMTLGHKPVFCLPGNPGATAICTLFFVIPFLRSLINVKSESDLPYTSDGRSSFSFSSPAETTCFVPVTYAQSGKEGVFTAVPSRGASDILCFSHATALLLIPAGQTLNVGDWCSAIPLN